LPRCFDHPVVDHGAHREHHCRLGLDGWAVQIPELHKLMPRLIDAQRVPMLQAYMQMTEE
jgi:hypothetical protein